MKTVRGFNAEDYESKRFDDQTNLAKKYDRISTHIFLILLLIIMILVYVIVAVILFYSATHVGTKQNGKLFNGGSLVAVF